MCPTRLKVSWTKERVDIGENEIEELDWEKTSNLCVAWKTDNKRWWWWWYFLKVFLFPSTAFAMLHLLFCGYLSTYLVALLHVSANTMNSWQGQRTTKISVFSRWHTSADYELFTWPTIKYRSRYEVYMLHSSPTWWRLWDELDCNIITNSVILIIVLWSEVVLW